MALVICKKCGTTFETSAKTCPHCGTKTPSVFGAMVKFFILLVLFSAFIGWLRGDQADRAAPDEPSVSGMYDDTIE